MTTGDEPLLGKDGEKKPRLPTVKLGGHEITRLIIGGNPFCGGSHYSNKMSADMLDHFTMENLKLTLFECERQGLNTMQNRGDVFIRRMVREYRNEGGTMHWIVQTASEYRDLAGNVRANAGAGAIALYHHGSRTDALWKEGKIDEVQELLKEMRDCGVCVGLGTHLPEVIQYAEEHNWDLDFYMACFYAITRRRDHVSPVIAGRESDELYLDEDREAMAATIRQTPKTCLAFKILAACRKCGSPDQVREAFLYAFDNIKPIDAVVVGMFPKYRNQVAENAAIVRELLAD